MSRILVVSLVILVPLTDTRLRANEQNQPQRQPPAQVSAGAATSGAYLEIAPLMIVQSAGVANHRVNPPVAGKVPGAAVAIGGFVTSALAMEAEVVMAGTISTPQRFSYTWREDYTAQSRDLLLNANLRYRPLRYLEVFGGGGLAISTFANRSVVQTDPFFERTSILPDREETSCGPTLGAGIAATVPIGPTLAIIPRFNVRWVKRSGDGLGLGGYMGAGGYAFQVGAAVRFKLGRTQ